MTEHNNWCCSENPTHLEQNNILTEAITINENNNQNENFIGETETINIKLVYHICFQNPGTTAQIDSDVQRTTDILNRDFNKNASNFDNGKAIYEAEVPSSPSLIPLIPYAKYRKYKKYIRFSRRRINQLRRELGSRRFINYMRRINRINRSRYKYNLRSRSINFRRRRINRNRSRSNRYRRRINNARMGKYNSDNAESLAKLNRYNNYVSRAGSCNINFTHDKTIVLSTPLADITSNSLSVINNLVKINGSQIQSGDEYKLNVWVVKFTTGLLGYAQFPWSYSTEPTTDGIVIDKNLFKQTELSGNFGIGGVITHEVGHWLGVYHPFQQSFTNQQGIIDTNDNGIIETDEKTGDLVVDTPNQSLPTSYINNNPYNAPTTWPKTTDYHMYMNYMDYRYDICGFMFTEEQCKKMRIFMNAYRSQFHTP